MPYTYKSLALVWLALAALFGIGGSGRLAGPWPLLLVLAALAVPFLLRGSVDVAPDAERSKGAAGGRDRTSAAAGNASINRWEDDGGAARLNAAGIRVAAPLPGNRAPLRAEASVPSGARR